MKYLTWKTSSIIETQKLLDDAIGEIGLPKRKKYFFAVIYKESNTIIGDVGFTIISQNKFGGIADSGFFLLKGLWVWDL